MDDHYLFHNIRDRSRIKFGDGFGIISKVMGILKEIDCVDCMRYYLEWVNKYTVSSSKRLYFKNLFSIVCRFNRINCLSYLINGNKIWPSTRPSTRRMKKIGRMLRSFEDDVDDVDDVDDIKNITNKDFWLNQLVQICIMLENYPTFEYITSEMEIDSTKIKIKMLSNLNRESYDKWNNSRKGELNDILGRNKLYDINITEQIFSFISII